MRGKGFLPIPSQKLAGDGDIVYLPIDNASLWTGQSGAHFPGTRSLSLKRLHPGLEGFGKWSGTAETVVVVRIVWIVVVTISDTQVVWIVVPRAAPQDAPRLPHITGK